MDVESERASSSTSTLSSLSTSTLSSLSTSSCLPLSLSVCFSQRVLYYSSRLSLTLANYLRWNRNKKHLIKKLLK